MRAIARYVPVIVLWLTGCARNRAPGAGSPASYGEMGRVEGQANGIGYLEFATGGARIEDPLPMIIVMHGRGGRTEKFETMFASFPVRARIIVPHGRANG